MTSISDSFPAGVPQLAWTRVEGTVSWVAHASGWMQLGTGAGTDTQTSMQANTALATNDMEVSVSVAGDRSATAGKDANDGPVARLSSTGGYELISVLSSTQASIILYRVVSHVRTSIATFSSLGVWDTTFRQLKLRVANATPVHLEVLLDNVSLGIVTDSNAARIQTGTKAGVAMHNGYNGAIVGYVDNFAAADYVYVPPIKNLAAKAAIATNAKQGVVLRYR
jgi:hypothetical protein